MMLILRHPVHLTDRSTTGQCMTPILHPPLSRAWTEKEGDPLTHRTRYLLNDRERPEVYDRPQ